MGSPVSSNQISWLSSCKNGLYKTFALARNRIYNVSLAPNWSEMEMSYGALKGCLVGTITANTVLDPAITITAISGAMVLAFLNTTKVYPNKVGDFLGGEDFVIIDIASSAFAFLAASFAKGSVAKFIVASIVGIVTSQAAQFVCKKLAPQYEPRKKDEIIKTGILCGVATTLTAALEPNGNATEKFFEAISKSMIAGALLNCTFRIRH